MPEKSVYLTEYDHKRLELLLSCLNSVPQNKRDDLSRLEDELVVCKIVPADQLPTTIICLNSRIRYLDLDSNQEKVVALVFPCNADLSDGRISVTSPLGAAIFGHSVGDIVACKILSKRKTIRIEEILPRLESAEKFNPAP